MGTQWLEAWRDALMRAWSAGIGDPATVWGALLELAEMQRRRG